MRIRLHGDFEDFEVHALYFLKARIYFCILPYRDCSGFLIYENNEFDITDDIVGPKHVIYKAFDETMFILNPLLLTNDLLARIMDHEAGSAREYYDLICSSLKEESKYIQDDNGYVS